MKSSAGNPVALPSGKVRTVGAVANLSLDLYTLGLALTLANT